MPSGENAEGSKGKVSLVQQNSRAILPCHLKEQLLKTLARISVRFLFCNSGILYFIP